MKELKKYEEPEMEIKYIDWSDIVTTSSTNTGETVRDILDHGLDDDPDGIVP